ATAGPCTPRSRLRPRRRSRAASPSCSCPGRCKPSARLHLARDARAPTREQRHEGEAEERRLDRPRAARRGAPAARRRRGRNAPLAVVTADVALEAAGEGAVFLADPSLLVA